MPSREHLLVTRNVKSRFYPFMEAASTKDATTIYTLLRANPVVVTIFIKPNIHEVYLKEKLAAAEKRVKELVDENKALKEDIEALMQKNGELNQSREDSSSFVSKRDADWSPKELEASKKARR